VVSDPVAFLNDFEKGLDHGTVLTISALQRLSDTVGRQRDKGKNWFDLDPLQLVENDQVLKGLGELEVTKGAYLREFWKAWLENYAFTLTRGPDSVKEDIGDGVLLAHMSWSVYSQISRVKEQIDKAAAQAQETGDAWIARFAPEIAARLQAEAKRRSEAERRAHKDEELMIVSPGPKV
jgi:hypothetical protein